MVTYNIDLDITPGGIPKVVHVKQYQTDATLVFKLHTRRGLLTIGNVTDCSIRGTKTDGNGYSASADYIVSSTSVEVELDEQMTAKAGRQPYEITVTDSTGKMITATFYLDVQRAALDGDTISASTIRELTDALDHTDEILEAYDGAHYDETPTVGSSKAVTSSGIRTYVDNSVAVVDDGNGRIRLFRNNGPYIDVDISKLIVGGLSPASPASEYVNTNNSVRISYKPFDMLVTPGDYTIRWTSSSDLVVGIVGVKSKF